MRLIYRRRASWPPLAWLARLRQGANEVLVEHGEGVETRDSWFCEAVWDGAFDHGDFDRTDIVAGSGARVRDGALIFVPAGNTVDRLQRLQVNAPDGDGWLVSNSLSCLVSAASASIDASYPGYYDDACSVVLGLSRYKRHLDTSAGQVELVYFHNFQWDGSAMRPLEKPTPTRDFSSFERFREFLDSCIAGIASNLAAPARTYPFRMLGTQSTGYDSTAVSALIRKHGCREVLTFDHARGNDSDNGTEIADCLGLKSIVLERQAWREQHEPELPFIASYSSGEDVNFTAAREHVRNTVLMTGYHGDKVWDKSPRDRSADLVRGDTSGLSLTEFRLHAGFINCAVPFFGARQIADLVRLSGSPEMQAFDVRGDYSRPLCRRIAEEAGVPREAFGVAKRAVTNNLFIGWDTRMQSGALLTPAALEDYLRWLREHRDAWHRSGRRPPIASVRVNAVVNFAHIAWIDLMQWLSRQPGMWRLVKYRRLRPQYLARHLFPWALARTASPYSDAPNEQAVPATRSSS